MRVVWSPAALLEILDIYNYIAADNPQAASRLADTLINLGNSLETSPNAAGL